MVELAAVGAEATAVNMEALTEHAGSGLLEIVVAVVLS